MKTGILYAAWMSEFLTKMSSVQLGEDVEQ